MKKALRLLALLALSIYGSAQSLTQVTATTITDGISTLAAGSICFQATDYFSGKPISFHPGGGGQAVNAPYCWGVVSGALVAGTFNVANPATASPSISYIVVVYDSSGLKKLAYFGVTFQGATFNFDNYLPGVNTVINYGSHAQCGGSQFAKGILANGDANCANVSGGTGTVTSVGLSLPSWLSVSGSPITTSGTLAISATGGQTQNQVLATPDGTSGTLAIRALVANDIPALAESKITNLVSDLATRAHQLVFFNDTGTDTEALNSGAVPATSLYLMSVHMYASSCSSCSFTARMECLDPNGFSTLGPSVTVTSDLSPTPNASGVYVCTAVGTPQFIRRVIRNSGTGNWTAYFSVTQVGQ